MAFHRLGINNNFLTFLLALLNFSATAYALPNIVTSTAPIVETLNGSYYGIHNDAYNQDFFLGVPFAQPPLNELRLRPPVSLNFTWSGLRNATEYGYACYGYGEDTQIGGNNYVSEDCLTLNIVRPSGCEDKALPVLLWIYGFVAPS